MYAPWSSTSNPSTNTEGFASTRSASSIASSLFTSSLLHTRTNVGGMVQARQGQLWRRCLSGDLAPPISAAGENLVHHRGRPPVHSVLHLGCSGEQSPGLSRLPPGLMDYRPVQRL